MPHSNNHIQSCVQRPDDDWAEKDFAEVIREWAEWNKRGAANAKLMFLTGFRQ